MHWIFDGPEMPQSAFSLDMPWHSNSNFFSCNCFIFSSRFQSISFYWSCDIRLEISWLVFSASCVDFWLVKIGKSALDTEIFRFSAHPSQKLQLWMLLSSSELTYLLFWFLDYSFIEQLNFKFKTSLLEFNVRSQNSGFAKTQKVLNFLDLATHFSPKNKVTFFHLGHNRIHCTYTREFHWKVIGFGPCVRVVIDR